MCTILGFHESLSAAVAALVADTALLMIMLIGLLRYAHRSSTGIWHLLYQQVIPCLLLPPVVDVLQVHHLDSLGEYCGGASCSGCISIS
jgi:hypothetical protein